MWQEALGAIARMFVEAPFAGLEGDYVQMPPRNVVPKPMQKPHPPVWVACSRRETIHLAAQKGIGALTFAFINPEEATHWVTDYYDTLAGECVPIGDAVNANVAAVTTFMCARTEEEALARGVEGGNFFGYSLAHYYVFGRHAPAQTDVWAEYQLQRADQGFSPEAVFAAANNSERLGAKVVEQGRTGLRGAIGTPDQIREYLQRFEEVGVDQVVFVSQAGKNRHEHIMESLELFGREVLPEFKERDDKAQRQKAARIAAAVDNALARKPAEDHPPLPREDYEFPAIPLGFADRLGNDEFFSALEEMRALVARGVPAREAFARLTQP